MILVRIKWNVIIIINIVYGKISNGALPLKKNALINDRDDCFVFKKPVISDITTTTGEEEEEEEVEKKIEDFRKLLTSKNRSRFVDKSLLIRELLERNETTTVIVEPIGYGKTVNNDMLKRFFRLQLTDDYRINVNNTDRRLFLGDDLNNHNEDVILNPLKISAVSSIVQRHQGAYPVISVGFRDLKVGRNLKELKIALGNKIRNLYDEYPYLRCRIERDDLARVILDQDWCLPEALRCLCKLLHDYFDGRRVIVLIDDYDMPMLNAYYRFEVVYEFVEALNFYGKLLVSTFKNNDYLERAVLTATVPVNRGDLYLIGASLYTQNEPAYNDYYAFTGHELVDKSISIERANVRASNIVSDNNTRYDPSSVSKWLINRKESKKKKNRKRYEWKDVEKHFFLHQALLSPCIQDDLHRLMTGRKIPVPMNWYDLDGQLDREIVRKMLLFSGYFPAIKCSISRIAATGVIGVRNTIAENKTYELYENDLIEDIVRIAVLKSVCSTMKIDEFDYRSLIESITITTASNNHDKKIEKFVDKLKKILSAIAHLTKLDQVGTFIRGFLLSMVNVLIRRGNYEIAAVFPSSNDSRRIYEAADKSILVLTKNHIEDDSANDNQIDALVVTHRIIKSPTTLKLASEKGMQLIDVEKDATAKKIARRLRSSESTVGKKRRKKIKILKIAFAFCENKFALKYQLDRN